MTINTENLAASYDALYAIALSGADPDNPFRGIEEFNGESSGAAGLYSSTISFSQVGDLVISMVAQFRTGPPLVDAAGMTLVENDNCVGCAYKDGAGSVAMGWDAQSADTNIWIQSVISIRPQDSFIQQIGTMTSDTDEGQDTVTFNHTLVAGNNRLALVFGVVEEDDAGDFIGTFTYGGVNCTMIAGCESTSQGQLNIGIGYVLEADLPADGVCAVEVVNGSAVVNSDLIGMAMVLENVMQEVPAVTEKAVATSTTVSDLITTVAARSLIVAMVGGVDATRYPEFVSDEFSIQGWEISAGNGALGVAFFEKLAAGAKTIQWTLDSGGDIGVASFALRPTHLAGGNPVMLGTNF